MGGGNKNRKRKSRNKNNQQNTGDAQLSKKQQPSKINDPSNSKKKTSAQDSRNLEERPLKPDSAFQKADDDMIESSMMISSTVAGTSSVKKNPLFTKLQSFLNGLTRTERDYFFSNQHVSPERRAEIWMAQADLGEELVNAYSWAVIPDIDNDSGQRIMRILAHFAPLVEMGCGKNAYWCRQMKAAGINVIGYDMAPQSGGLIIQKHNKGQKNGDKKKDDNDGHAAAFQVRMGGPKDLSKHSNRTLFLCYPDENDEQQNDDENDNEQEAEMSLSMGARCLQYYTGNHVIHVGEIYGDTNSMEQAPWGRSSSPEFQQRLASEFHCILQVALPSWLHVRDTLSVWKRSEICTIVYAQDDDDDDDDGEGHDDDEEEEEVQYRHVPVEERLPMDRAAPCVAHLLDSSSSLAMSRRAVKDDDNSKRHENHHHHHPSKKPKLVAKQQHETQEEAAVSAKQAKISPKKSKSKEEEQPAAFSKEEGYSTPW